MKDKLLQIKKGKPFETVKNYQSNKTKMIDPTLKKYLDMTINRFNAKCSTLVSQIEEMKREFVTQLEGIGEFFPIAVSKIPFPSVSPVRKYNVNTIEQHRGNNEIQNTQETYCNTQMKGNNYDIRSGGINKTEQNEDTSVKVLSNRFCDDQRKNSLKPKDQDNQAIKLKVVPKESKNSTKEDDKKKEKKIISPKIKALISLGHSDILNFEEKMQIRKLNKILHQDTSILSICISSKKYLEEKINSLTNQKINEVPSQTSQSSLNFIKKENENELKDMSNKLHLAFYKLVYILSGENIPVNISYEHLYESVLRKNQAQSIKHLFLTVILKKLVESPNDFTNEMIDKFNVIINENPELISQKDLLNENKSLSLFAFSLKELDTFFKNEVGNRLEIQRLKLLLNQLNTKMSVHCLI